MNHAMHQTKTVHLIYYIQAHAGTKRFSYNKKLILQQIKQAMFVQPQATALNP
jgi:hypothetical protein